MNRIVATAALGFLAMSAVAQAESYGRHERVRVLASVGIEVDARLDPSAAGSTLRAAEVKYFNRGGGTWVRFVIDNGGVLSGSRVPIERPVLKDSKVRQRDGSTEHRPIVTLPLCLGRTRIETLVSVTERSGYTEPLTLGGKALAGLGRIDAGREYTVEPSCPPDPAGSTEAVAAGAADPSDAEPAAPERRAAKFACDGRQHCSQMRSREEAQFFLTHCPDPKMDGDGDGEACENDSRW